MNKLEELKKELADLKESNKGAWDMYGSELCAGDMIGKERRLEELIEDLENPKPLSPKAQVKFDELFNLMPTSEFFETHKDLQSVQLITEKDMGPVMIIKKNRRKYKYKGFDDIIDALKELRQ